MDENGFSLFSHLSSFVLLIMVMIANSNASSERVWRKVTLTKSLLRTRMELDNMKSLLLASELINDEGGIIPFTPTDDMIYACRDVKTRYFNKQKTNPIEPEDVSSELLRNCRLDDIMYNRKHHKKVNYLNHTDKNNKKLDKRYALITFT